jgi:hypothetical protein
MKYDLNRINIKSYTQKVGSFGGKWIEIYFFGVHESNFTINICCGQHWNIDRIFNIYLDYLNKPN